MRFLSFLFTSETTTTVLLVVALVVTLALAFVGLWRHRVVTTLGSLGMFALVAHVGLAFYATSLYADYYMWAGSYKYDTWKASPDPWDMPDRMNDLLWNLHAVTAWMTALLFFSATIIVVVRYFRARKERNEDRIRLENVPKEETVTRAMHAEPAGSTPRM